jgi:hypothetical protein
MPDTSRAARYVLKDYVSAKLVFCHPPPGIDADTYMEDSRAKMIEKQEEDIRVSPMLRRMLNSRLESVKQPPSLSDKTLPLRPDGLLLRSRKIWRTHSLARLALCQDRSPRVHQGSDKREATHER